jgi:hypothetical protein
MRKGTAASSDLIRNNESHAPHISGKVVNMLASSGGPDTVFKNTQVKQQEFITKFLLLHEFIFFPISTDDIASLESDEEKN